MTRSDTPDGHDLAPENAELSLVSSLSVGLPGSVPEDTSSALQGDAPADLGSREAPPVPTPSTDGLNAEEVARLTATPGKTPDTDGTES